jgi:hypothetical protein
MNCAPGRTKNPQSSVLRIPNKAKALSGKEFEPEAAPSDTVYAAHVLL